MMPDQTTLIVKRLLSTTYALNLKEQPVVCLFNVPPCKAKVLWAPDCTV